MNSEKDKYTKKVVKFYQKPYDPFLISLPHGLTG